MSAVSDAHGELDGRTKAVIFVAIAVSVLLPMIVSSQQAGRFFQSLGTGTDAAILFATACGIIFSNPVVAVLIGHTASLFQKVLAYALCFGIISFSVLTTTIAIHNKTGEKIVSEQQSSSFTQSTQSAIDSNLAAIKSLQEQIDALDPYKWRTKRSQFASQIQMLQMQNMQLMDKQQVRAEAGGGSVTGETFAKLEEWGITRFGLSVLAAVLLDAIPFVVCLIIGTMLVMKHRKKHYVANGSHSFGAVGGGRDSAAIQDEINNRFSQKKK